MFSSDFDRNHFIIRSLNGLALSKARQGYHNEAMEFINRAIAIEREIYGQNNLQFAKSTEILGRCNWLNKDYINGLIALNKSIDVLSSNLNSTAEALSESKALLFAQFLRE